MQNFFLVLLSTIVTFNIAICQEINIDDVPSKGIEKKAKNATIASIDSLATILELTKKERKVRHFKLDYCMFYTDVPQEEFHRTPAGNFPTVRGCPGMYYYILQTNQDTGNYFITFFYDEAGNIIAREILFEMVFK